MFRAVFTLLAFFIFALNQNTVASKTAKNRPRVKFYCGIYYGVLSTIAIRPPSPVEHQIIRWRDDWAGEYGISLQQRCNRISEGFQAYYEKGIVKYIIGGTDQEGQGIICVAQNKEGPCTGRLWTLRPTDNPDEVVKRLCGVLTHYADPVNQSSSIYCDIEEILPIQ